MYVEKHSLGRIGISVRHGMPGDPYNDRMPDVSFTHRDRLLPIVSAGAVQHMPDLAVEINTPENTIQDLRAKAAYYLAHRSLMVWLARAEEKLIEVYQPDADVQILDINDTLDGDPLLPGFRLPVREVFDL